MDKIDIEFYTKLVAEYKKAPELFQAAQYWNTYEKPIFEELSNLNPERLRSGDYPFLSSFGFSEVYFKNNHKHSKFKQLKTKVIRRLVGGDSYSLPYSMGIRAVQEMAYHHCELYGELTNSMPINTIETSSFGSPQDIFDIDGRKYTMGFLNFYIRYCFANKYLNFNGSETIVELGSGSGHQIEVLKKLFPDMTILCFDMPAQLYLCQLFLCNSLGEKNVVKIEETHNWVDLSKVEKGKVHFLGNWQIPLIKNFKHDVFWNAASFGEMEPHIVENYMSYVLGEAENIFCLQARNGKEQSGITQVKSKSTFEDYDKVFMNYKLVGEEDAYYANKRMSMSGGYFQGVWKNSAVE